MGWRGRQRERAPGAPLQLGRRTVHVWVEFTWAWGPWGLGRVWDLHLFLLQGHGRVNGAQTEREREGGESGAGGEPLTGCCMSCSSCHRWRSTSEVCLTNSRLGARCFFLGLMCFSRLRLILASQQ